MSNCACMFAKVDLGALRKVIVHASGAQHMARVHTALQHIVVSVPESHMDAH